MKTSNSDEFEIKRVTLNQKGCNYDTHRVIGWLNGLRIRRQFTSHQEALREKSRFQVQVANADGEIQAVNTRLSVAQVCAAETAFDRLGEHIIGDVVYFLATYRPPILSETNGNAIAEFMRDKKSEMSVPVIVDDRKVTKILFVAFFGPLLNTIATPEAVAVMGAWVQSKKWTPI